jgi:hypothetical protein
MISTHGTRAHVRLLESIPRERIRTHEQKPMRSEPQGRGTGLRVPMDLRARRRAIVAELVGAHNPSTGRIWRYDEIGMEIGRRDAGGGISKASVAKYARQLRGGRYGRPGR